MLLKIHFNCILEKIFGRIITGGVSPVITISHLVTVIRMFFIQGQTMCPISDGIQKHCLRLSIRTEQGHGDAPLSTSLAPTLLNRSGFRIKVVPFLLPEKIKTPHWISFPLNYPARFP